MIELGTRVSLWRVTLDGTSEFEVVTVLTVPKWQGIHTHNELDDMLLIQLGMPKWIRNAHKQPEVRATLVTEHGAWALWFYAN